MQRLDGGFGCDYDVYVADRFSPTMKHALHVSRNACETQAPRVRWNDDRSVVLVDASGKPLQNESRGLFFGGGC